MSESYFKVAINIGGEECLKVTINIGAQERLNVTSKLPSTLEVKNDV